MLWQQSEQQAEPAEQTESEQTEPESKPEQIGFVGLSSLFATKKQSNRTYTIALSLFYLFL